MKNPAGQNSPAEPRRIYLAVKAVSFSYCKKINNLITLAEGHGLFECSSVSMIRCAVGFLYTNVAYL